MEFHTEARRHGDMKTENEIGGIVVDCAIKVHQKTGPGLLESVYEVILGRELEKSGLAVQRQVVVQVWYEGETLDLGFRADLIVENKVLLELKSVEAVHRVHKKQLLTYLKLADLRIGYLLNFGAPLMKDGICRIIHNHQ